MFILHRTGQSGGPPCRGWIARPELEANMDGLTAPTRAMMVTGLREAGSPVFAPPDGAFYLCGMWSSLTNGQRELARDIY